MLASFLISTAFKISIRPYNITYLIAWFMLNRASKWWRSKKELSIYIFLRFIGVISTVNSWICSRFCLSLTVTAYVNRKLRTQILIIHESLDGMVPKYILLPTAPAQKNLLFAAKLPKVYLSEKQPISLAACAYSPQIN